MFENCAIKKFHVHIPGVTVLSHWDRVTHICISKLTIIGSDNGLSPGWYQAIIWTNARILLVGTLGTNFSEILIEIQTFSLKKMRLKMSSAKWRPFRLGINVLNECSLEFPHTEYYTLHAIITGVLWNSRIMQASINSRGYTGVYSSYSSPGLGEVSLLNGMVQVKLPGMQVDFGKKWIYIFLWDNIIWPSLSSNTI